MCSPQRLELRVLRSGEPNGHCTSVEVRKAPSGGGHAPDLVADSDTTAEAQSVARPGESGTDRWAPPARKPIETGSRNQHHTLENTPRIAPSTSSTAPAQATRVRSVLRQQPHKRWPAPRSRRSAKSRRTRSSPREPRTDERGAAPLASRPISPSHRTGGESKPEVDVPLSHLNARRQTSSKHAEGTLTGIDRGGELLDPR